MPIHDGVFKEYEMIHYLKDKRIQDLNPNLKSFLIRLFGRVEENEYVNCEKIEGSSKADFVVTYKHRKKYISMKSGNGKVVHHELLISFIIPSNKTPILI